VKRRRRLLPLSLLLSLDLLIHAILQMSHTLCIPFPVILSAYVHTRAPIISSAFFFPLLSTTVHPFFFLFFFVLSFFFDPSFPFF
jgi:hypothetical protein